MINLTTVVAFEALRFRNAATHLNVEHVLGVSIITLYVFAKSGIRYVVRSNSKNYRLQYTSPEKKTASEFMESLITYPIIANFCHILLKFDKMLHYGPNKT